VNRDIAILVVALIPALFASPCAAQDNAKQRAPSFTVSKETTFITDPVDKDGRIDYITALNQRWSKGVTPDNNAVVLLVQAFGPAPDGTKRLPAFYERLKTPEPPERGDYFVDTNRFCREHLKFTHNDQFMKFGDDQESARLRPWSAKQFPTIAAWLKANEKPLTIVIQASKRSHYYAPVVTSDPRDKPRLLLAMPSTGAQHHRQFAYALTNRAMLHAAEGRPADAWQDVLACYRLGRHVAGSGGAVDCLTGLAIESMSSDAALAFIDGAKLDAKTLKQCLGDLQKLPALPSVADHIGIAERFVFLDSVMFMDRSGAANVEFNAELEKLKGPINWDPALIKGNKMFTEFAEAMRLAEYRVRDKKIGDIEKTYEPAKLDAKKLAKAIQNAADPAKANGEALADPLIGMLTPAVRRIRRSVDGIEQGQRNVQLAFALAVYKTEKGRYPTSLSSLAPDYVASVPGDLFSGKALVYRTSDDGYLLYSIGVNETDDPGNGDDRAVRMPIPKQK
jgi:hypothetical protein